MKFIKLTFPCILSIFFTQHSSGQYNVNSLDNWHDTNIGRENLPFNNGYLYNDVYNLALNNSPFLIDQNYGIGSLNFDGQLYNNLHLNYDIYRDILLLKANGDQDLRAVSVIKNDTDYFIFNGKKFLNLSNANYPKPNNSGGFYEEKVISTNVTLFTKHSKSKSEKILKEKVVTEFSGRKEFLILKNNSLFKYEKSELQHLYPNLRTELNSYYSENAKLEKSDEQQFIENLLTQLEVLSN